MKKIGLMLMLIMTLSTMTAAIEVPNWVDPNRYDGFALIHTQDNLCQNHTYTGQWSLVDSKQGILVCSFVELPAGALVDPNGRIEFTPILEGVYYIQVILSCEPAVPEACVWPTERREAVAVKVLPSVIWEPEFTPFAD